MQVPAIAMPFQLGFGDIGDEVILEGAGRLQVAAAAMTTLLRVDVVFNKRRSWRRLGSKHARMLTMLLKATVVRSALARRACVLEPFAALQEALDLLLE